MKKVRQVGYQQELYRDARSDRKIFFQKSVLQAEYPLKILIFAGT